MSACGFPQWFEKITLSNDPNKRLDQFSKAIKNALNSGKISPLSEVVDIFGKLNINRLAETLPELHRETFKATVLEWLQKQEAQFNRTRDVVKEAWAQSKCANLDRLDSIYSLSIGSFEGLQDHAASEMVRYLTSLPMPFQEYRFKYLSLKRLQPRMEDYQQKLDSSVTLLFQIAEQGDGPLLGYREQQLLAKHAAIRGRGKMISWLALGALWSNTERAESACRGLLQDSPFHGLLFELQPAIVGKVASLTFRQFFLLKTKEMMMTHFVGRDALFQLLGPPQELDQLFSASPLPISVMQDILYFLDYLCTLPKHGLSPFFEALSTLKQFFPEEKEAPHPFLKRCLYFLLCKHYLSMKEEEADTLFHSVMQKNCGITNEDNEPFHRGGVDPALLNELIQTKRLEPEESAIILIKSYANTEHNGNTKKCPYLSFTEHWNAIVAIDHFFGIQLPVSLITPILFFQTARGDIFAVLEAFREMRHHIIEQWQDSIALPRALYDAWQSQAMDLGTCFDSSHNKGIPRFASSMLDRYPYDLGTLSRLIQYAVYPLRETPIRSIIPTDVNQIPDHSCYIYAEEQKDEFAPLCTELPEGLHRRYRWVSMRVDIEFRVTLKKGEQTSDFVVPLKLPEDDALHSLFFATLKEMVDLLGIEVLDEGEEKVVAKAATSSAASAACYSLSDELIASKTPTCELFDALAEPCLPLFTSYLQLKDTLGEGEALSGIKVSLLTFIMTYRRLYKRHFYSLMGPLAASL